MAFMYVWLGGPICRWPLFIVACKTKRTCTYGNLWTPCAVDVSAVMQNSADFLFLFQRVRFVRQVYQLKVASANSVVLTDSVECFSSFVLNGFPVLVVFRYFFSF